MITPHEQLDRRFADIEGLARKAQRPPRGWIRAIRQALGMTTGQLAQRMGVKQPRVVELEKSESTDAITVRSLQRAAEAMGCRLVYVLVPELPLSETLNARAARIADQHLAAVDQTMGLEGQRVPDKTRFADTRRQMIADLLRRPARLWDTP